MWNQIMVGNKKKITMKSRRCGTELSRKINVSIYLPRTKNICSYIIMSYLREHNEQKFTKSVTKHHG